MRIDASLDALDHYSMRPHAVDKLNAHAEEAAKDVVEQRQKRVCGAREQADYSLALQP